MSSRESSSDLEQPWVEDDPVKDTREKEGRLTPFTMDIIAG